MEEKNMIDAQHWILFFTATTLTAISPGPALLYVLARTLRGGRGEGVRSIFGLVVGGQVHTLAATFGISALIATSTTAFSVLKYLGAAYLVYLGIKTLTARDAQPGSVSPSKDSNNAFWQGVITEALNPKTALFFLTFIPQFVQPERGNVLLQSLVLGSLTSIVFLLADLIMLALAAPIGELLRSNPRFRRSLKYTSGGMLIALGSYTALKR
jgi:threonine/homoserine/homoserine lactone efflux protein